MGEKVIKGDKHHLVHNFTQGHFWFQCKFNIEFVLFHNEYLAKPLKNISMSQNSPLERQALGI